MVQRECLLRRLGAWATQQVNNVTNLLFSHWSSGLGFSKQFPWWSGNELQYQWNIWLRYRKSFQVNVSSKNFYIYPHWAEWRQEYTTDPRLCYMVLNQPVSITQKQGWAVFPKTELKKLGIVSKREAVTECCEFNHKYSQSATEWGLGQWQASQNYNEAENSCHLMTLYNANTVQRVSDDTDVNNPTVPAI